MRFCLSLLLIFSITSLTLARQTVTLQEPANNQSSANPAPLTNKDVLDMIKGGLNAEIVIAKIRKSPTNFDTSPAALSELKTAGLPDAVILAMVQPATELKAAPAADKSDALVKVSDGTEIEVQLKNNASGEELKVGDIVDFTVVRPVVVNGVTIFDKDAPARARITTAKRAGHWGHAGKLEWAMQDIQAVDGSRVSSRFTKRLVGDSKGNTVAVAAVATTVLLGPFGLLWGLKKGKPAIIPAGNRYSVFVNGEADVKGKPATTTAVSQ
jgi:hypothetical protein